jgi:hypothetical protein
MDWLSSTSTALSLCPANIEARTGPIPWNNRNVSANAEQLFNVFHFKQPPLIFLTAILSLVRLLVLVFVSPPFGGWQS